jgi:hypothetical protein
MLDFTPLQGVENELEEKKSTFVKSENQNSHRF